MPDALPVEEEDKMKPRRKAKVTPPAPIKTGLIFLGEEDKILIRKMNEEIVKKLGIKPNKSFKV